MTAVLVADIGGTNARFALAELTPSGVAIGELHAFRAEDHETVGDAARAFLEAERARPKVACFAVAGPVTGAVVEFTNSSWVLDIAKVQEQLSLARLIAVNDFEALATSVRWLAKEDFAPVKAGHAVAGAPVVVIGPGTGLGQALIIPTRHGDRIIATEGGHIAFAPNDEEEIEVWRFIARERQRVSVERLLSGSGLVNIYRALCEVTAAPHDSLQADEISMAAKTGADAVARRALAMFCAILGSAAGDAVLASGGRGGVVLGGGILPKIREFFLASAFVARFLEKGRMKPYVEGVPVDLIVRDGAALVGAAARLKAETRAR